MPDSQFKKAYEYFRRRLRDHISDDGLATDPKRILEIIERRLMVVMINLSDADDPYLIFESLNFKGSPLEQSDLVRNYFLMRFPVTEQQAIYESLWLPMQNQLGPDLTEFMRHFLGAEGEEVRKTDIYAAIKRLVTDADAASVRLLMTRMEKLSLLYSRISARAPEPVVEIGRYFDHFRRLNVGSVYPLALALYEDHAEGQFGVDEFIAALRVLHSFIIRRMIVGVPSNSLAGLFISLCRTKECGKRRSRGSIRAALPWDTETTNLNTRLKLIPRTSQSLNGFSSWTRRGWHCDHLRVLPNRVARA